MAEFTKVVHEWARMCKAYSDAGDCMKCPLVTNPICGMSYDNGVSDKEISKAESDIMSWATENPEPVYPTFAEWLNSIGVTVSDRPFRAPIIPVYVFQVNAKMFEPIPADIAQKLGIEPKEG